jgi:exodeoxyribonuclease VII small subunit
VDVVANNPEETPGAAQGADDPSLERRLRRLTEIVETLEADEVELDRALALFEEGIGHVQMAERLLAQAELKVEELVRRAGGTETRPLDAEDA